MNKSDINLLITVFVMGNIYREVKVQNKFDIITDAHPFIFFLASFYVILFYITNGLLFCRCCKQYKILLFRSINAWC